MKQLHLNVILLAALLLASSGLCHAEDARLTLNLWPNTFLEDDGHPPEGVEPDRGDGVIRVNNVSVPTIALYPAPKTEQPSPAVLICPGGGYSILAINKEGTELAEWLNGIGVTALVLKYRVPKNRPSAFQDGQRAMGLIRQHAREWHIAPECVGVMGFSAGGHLAASLSTRYEKRAHAPLDEADTLNCRPDFTMLIYPAYLNGDGYKLVEEVKVTPETPPCFLVQTQDDKNYVDSSIAYYLACKAAGVPAEIHLYPHGGHGYGMRTSPHAVSGWPTLCAAWLTHVLKP